MPSLRPSRPHLFPLYGTQAFPLTEAQPWYSIAGGETTATSLAAALYYVLKSPDVLSRLAAEIRTRYGTYGEIDAASVLQLSYLQAVLNEALRIHPSGAHGFPRISPGAVVDGHWVPAGVSLLSDLYLRSGPPAHACYSD